MERRRLAEVRLDADDIYQKIVKAKPQFENDYLLVQDVVSEISKFEEAAEKDKGRVLTSAASLENIGAIWVFSGPGTYDSPIIEEKDGPYKDFTWTYYMDRARLNHAAILARKIALVRSGQGLNNGSLANIRESKDETIELLGKYGPQIIYNGTKIENDVVQAVLTRPGIVIPQEKVTIIRDNTIKKTVDQIKTFQMPFGFREGQELAIISHAPQLARVLRKINKSKPFPGGTKVRLFPLATPLCGKIKYAEMETEGVLYYVHSGDATRSAYPYTI
ncbi:MAG: hypothetical protein M1450_00760 [Patescibacteria group bacterium]|nr:hypothetical protein [Patescibacteria group bacterium]